MTDISCEMCMDLMPLVRDGIASPDSTAAVRRHLAGCACCRSFYEGEAPTPPDAGRVWQSVQRKTRLFSGMLLMFGLVFGLSLSGDGSLFYNVLLMPLLGALGYGLFRWKALYTVPVLLTATHFLMNALGLVWQGEKMDWSALLLWSFWYGVLALVGAVIAGLLHFALRKEN